MQKKDGRGQSSFTCKCLLVSSHLFSFYSIRESRLLSLDLSKEWHKSELLNLRESFPTITDAASQRTSFDIRESSVSSSACSLTMQAKFSGPWIFSIFGCKAIKVAHLTNLETFSLSWKNIKQNYLTNDLNIENHTYTPKLVISRKPVLKIDGHNIWIHQDAYAYAFQVRISWS